MKKKFLVSFCFLLIGTFWLKTASADSYYYFQYNIVSNLYTTSKYDLTSTSNTSEGITVTDSTVKAEAKLFDTQYNNNFMVGYNFNNSFGADLEFAAYKIMQHKIGGKVATASDRNFALNTLSYYMFNVKYNIMSLGNFTPFMKLGLGAAFFDTPSRNTQGYGNRFSPAVQGVLGTSYYLNSYIDLEGSVKYFMNFPKKVMIASTSVEQAYYINQFNLYLGIKFKIPA